MVWDDNLPGVDEVIFMVVVVMVIKICCQLDKLFGGDVIRVEA